MANRKISELPVLGSPAATSVAAVVSASTTYKVTLADIVAAGAAAATSTTLGVVKVGSGLSVDVTGLLSAPTAGLEDLDDTAITNAADSELIIYSSGNWRNTSTLDAGEV